MKTNEKIHYTPRELEIIKLLLLRVNRKLIADKLKIAVATVKAHIKNLLQKTSEHCVTDMIVFLLTSDFSVNAERTEVMYLGKII